MGRSVRKAKWILLFTIATVLFYGAASSFVDSNRSQTPSFAPKPTPLPTYPPGDSSGVPSASMPSPIEDERKRIDRWIEKNNLNKYGDPKDTVYTGATPLFDETTGKSIDRYDYIRKRHPDRPWNR